MLEPASAADQGLGGTRYSFRNATGTKIVSAGKTQTTASDSEFEFQYHFADPRTLLNQIAQIPVLSISNEDGGLGSIETEEDGTTPVVFEDSDGVTRQKRKPYPVGHSVLTKRKFMTRIPANEQRLLRGFCWFEDPRLGQYLRLSLYKRVGEESGHGSWVELVWTTPLLPILDVRLGELGGGDGMTWG